MTDLHTYLQNIAISHISIAHNPADVNKVRFKRKRVEEIQGGTNLDMNNFCLFYFNYEGSIIGNNADQLYDRKKVTIVIAKGFETGNVESLDTTQDACLEICKDIHAKMIYDYSQRVILKLNYEVDYYKFTTAIDNMAAVGFDVDIDFTYNSNYNPAKWL